MATPGYFGTMLKDNPALSLSQEDSPLTSGSSYTPPPLAPQGNFGLEALYAVSGLSGNPNTQKSIGRIIELTRQQRAVEGISVAIDNAQNAVNKNDYGTARSTLQDAIRNATLVAPEYLKFLVPQFADIQKQEQQFLGNKAILSNLIRRANAIPEGNSPDEKKANDALRNKYFGMAQDFANAKGLTPADITAQIAQQRPEVRPVPEQFGAVVWNPDTGQPEFKSYGAQESLGSIDKETATALASFGIGPPQIINALRNPETADIAKAALAMARRTAAGATYAQQVGPENAALLSLTGQTPTGFMQSGGALQGQQPTASQVTSSKPQAKAPQGVGQPGEWSFSLTLPSGSGQTLSVPGKTEKEARQNLESALKAEFKDKASQIKITTLGSPQESGTMATMQAAGQAISGATGSAAETILGGKTAAQTKAKQQTELNMPSTTPGSQPGLDATTGRPVNASQVAVGSPNFVQTTPERLQASQGIETIRAKLDAYEKTVRETMQTVGWKDLMSQPTEALKSFANANIPFLKARYETWQKIEEAHADLDRAYQNYAKTVGADSREAESIRLGLKSSNPQVVMNSIQRMRSSLEAMQKSLVPPDTRQPLQQQAPVGGVAVPQGASGAGSTTPSATPASKPRLKRIGGQ